jgi:hypothetical protein
MGKVAAATRGTLSFFLQLFVLLYAMFFFLLDGPAILRKILYYIPLDPAEEEALLERFVSVTRATLKGSLLIGVIQGAAAGLAFWVAGVPGDLAVLPPPQAGDHPLGFAAAPVRVRLQEPAPLQAPVPEVPEERHQLLPGGAAEQPRERPGTQAVFHPRAAKTSPMKV